MTLNLLFFLLALSGSLGLFVSALMMRGTLRVALGGVGAVISIALCRAATGEIDINALCSALATGLFFTTLGLLVLLTSLCLISFLTLISGLTIFNALAIFGYTAPAEEGWTKILVPGFFSLLGLTGTTLYTVTRLDTYNTILPSLFFLSVGLGAAYLFSEFLKGIQNPSLEQNFP